MLSLGVRLNWYRSVPLSCIERLEIALDGVPLDPRARHWSSTASGPRSATSPRSTSGGGTSSTPRPSGSTSWSGRPRARTAVDLVIGTRIPYLVSPSGAAAVIVDRARAEVSP